MADKSADSALEFPINQTLLEEAVKQREEWLIVRDRVAKIEQSKHQVAPVVYERVRKDYKARLAKVTADLMKKKEAVDHELATLCDTKKRVGAQLAERTNKLDEIKFRNTLGEFSEEEYQSATKAEQDKIAKFETILGAVDSNISRYEAIFEKDAEFMTHEGTRVEGAKEEEYATDLHPIADKEEEAESDYFQAMTDAGKTETGIEESQTAKDAVLHQTVQGADAAGAKGRLARVVVVTGPDAGEAYPVKGVISFGRAESSTVVLKDSKVSRQHAQIQEQGSEYMLVDLNSSNGTFVNKQRVEEHVLSNGDEIQIGDCVLQFQL